MQERAERRRDSVGVVNTTSPDNSNNSEKLGLTNTHSEQGL